MDQNFKIIFSCNFSDNEKKRVVDFFEINKDLMSNNNLGIIAVDNNIIIVNKTNFGFLLTKKETSGFLIVGD